MSPASDLGLPWGCRCAHSQLEPCGRGRHREPRLKGWGFLRVWVSGLGSGMLQGRGPLRALPCPGPSVAGLALTPLVRAWGVPVSTKPCGHVANTSATT